MTAASETIDRVSFTNPVYTHSFPDPYILEFRGVYYAFCTGDAAGGRIFGMLRSDDLVNWTVLPGAMEPLESRPPFYWAPEAVYRGGKFYLYYSAGNEALMELRVAVADEPQGPYVDSGRKLTHQDFAIDAHVFRDPDGTDHMFYATDFLEHEFIGTGTVVDRMLDPFTLAGDPRPVTRAKYDWQVYDPNRAEKGGVRWHTVEGPFVVERKGVYFEMFSGGNWQNISYGVSFAVSDEIYREGEWDQFCDGEVTKPLLATIPERVIGPGHNAVIKGPDGRELYCVYHRWTGAGRVMAIDRMDFAGPKRLFVIGPTDTPQPAPRRPGSSLEAAGTSFLCSFWTQGLPGELITIMTSGGGTEIVKAKTGVANNNAWHKIAVDIDHQWVSVTVDGLPAGELALEAPAASAVCTETAQNLAVTRGFEDRFESLNLELRGWTVAGDAVIEDRCLRLAGRTSTASIRKAFPAGPFEAALNFRIDASDDGARLSADGLFTLDPRMRTLEVGGTFLQLPQTAELTDFHQLRFVCDATAVQVFVDQFLVGTVDKDVTKICQLGMVAERCDLTLDMVRLTMS